LTLPVGFLCFIHPAMDGEVGTISKERLGEVVLVRA
jgi:hypothetical protein